MINANLLASLTRPNTADVFRWFGYLSWIGGAIFMGVLIATRDCQRSEHIASVWGGIVVLSMISPYAVKVRCAQWEHMQSSGNVAGKLVRPGRTRATPTSLAPDTAHLHAAAVRLGLQ
jgi:hypothetical protein